MQKPFQTKKNRPRGFTLVELLVVIAVIALLMAILLPALTKAREQGKRAVCLTHIKQLQLAWNMYCDANNEKVPVGDVWYSWTFTANNKGGPSQRAWHEWPHQPHTTPPSYATNYTNSYPGDCVQTGQCLKDSWYHAIDEGTMWKYVKDYRIYQCPVGDKGEYVTYAMTHSMNTWCESPSNASAGPGSFIRTIILRNQMKRTSERIVFLDAGFAKRGAFFLRYDGPAGSPPAAQGHFGDHAPIRHGRGTTFSFVDGHSEYRKWTDLPPDDDNPKTWGGPQSTANTNACDWRWWCRSTWGDVPVAQTDLARHCND